MNSLLEFIEKGFAVFALVILSGAVVPLLVSGGGSATALQGNPKLLVFYYVVYVVTFFLVLARWKSAVRVVMKNKLLFVLMFITLASVFWSDAPTVTLRRSLALIGTNLVGVYLSTRYNLKDQLHLLAWALGIGVVLSIVFALALPSYGIMSGTHQGAWRGVYMHKNPMGRIMDLSAMVFLLLAITRHKYRWIMWAGFGLSVSLILLSTSKTALSGFLTLLLLLPLYRAWRWRPTRAVPFFISVIIIGGSAATLFLENAEIILGAIGRDLTFTGRTDLWVSVLDKILERPWLGYGFGGFWLGWNGESADVWALNTWGPPHAHNGFLDLLLDLGLLGFLVFALNFLIVCARAITWARSTRTSEGFWPLIYLTFMLLFNQTESTILVQHSIFWALYLAIACSPIIQHDKVVEPGVFAKYQQKVQ